MMTAHIVNADNPSPAPTHSVPGVPVVDVDSPSSAPGQSQPSAVPAPADEAPEPSVEVHDHAVEPMVNVEQIDVKDAASVGEAIAKVQRRAIADRAKDDNPPA